MFDSQVFSTKQRRRTKSSLTLPFAVVVHVIGFGGLIVGSFLSVESVPAPPITISFVAAAPPPPPPPPPPPARKKRTQTEKPKEIPKPTEIVQPKIVPEEQPKPIDAPEDVSDDEGEDEGVEGGVEGGLGDQPLYAGIGGVTNPELIPSTKVQPKYPEIARKAKIQGKVVLQAVIKKDGSVGDIQVLQSPGAKFGFDEAAIAAVRQWRYKPGLQNGKPVDVYFTVVVTFELN